MRRNWLTQLGCLAGVAAVALTFVPAAHAQRMMRSDGRMYGGYQSGYVNPYSGWNQGFGYGSYPGAYSNYSYPGYSSGIPGSYYSMPGYYNAPSTTAAAGNLPNQYQYPMAGAINQAQWMSPPTAGTALITVRLPADATLLVDDLPTTQTGPMRQFVTPGALEPGKPYHYNLKAQWTENGQPVTRERKVDFQAGGQAMVDFTRPTGQMGAPVTTESLYPPTAETALITVRLPANATLFVDDLPTTPTGPMRQFVTPGRLEPGKPYHYNLKAQWTENGQPVTRERKVDFQAGGQVNVDFTSGTEQ
jgi:uncharacterized protein (TIGR03000 family)